MSGNAKNIKTTKGNKNLNCLKNISVNEIRQLKEIP